MLMVLNWTVFGVLLVSYWLLMGKIKKEKLTEKSYKLLGLWQWSSYLTSLGTLAYLLWMVAVGTNFLTRWIYCSSFGSLLFLSLWQTFRMNRALGRVYWKLKQNKGVMLSGLEDMDWSLEKDEQGL